jgi:hypothetical protein
MVLSVLVLLRVYPAPERADRLDGNRQFAAAFRPDLRLPWAGFGIGLAPPAAGTREAIRA